MTKKVFIGTLVFLFTALTSYAQQPYAGSWQPSDIASWSADRDPDAKFNRSTVPLQPRVSETNATAIKANNSQYVEGQHAPALLITPNCSTCPSQGENNNFTGNNPTYWQYMDMLIWWAGSAAEGLFCLPDPGTTDIAHLNGVKVLAQLFFPPTAYGGNSAHVSTVLSNSGGKYSYAEKMAEIANFYGFDGWFINEETLRSESGWSGWINYYHQYCASKGWNQHIQWYDATTSNSQLVNIENTSKFKEYGATSQANGLFDKYYYGIECAQQSYGYNASYFTNLFPTSGHKGSLATFNPDYQTWKRPVYENTTGSGTQNLTGTTAYSAINTFLNSEAAFYVNPNKNPSAARTTSGYTWPGLATAMVERSAITSLPFVTSFSHGQGKARYVNGENRGTMDWYHRGMQDILPTWRYWSSKTATITHDWDNVYNVGTSLKITNSQANNDIYLFKTQVTIPNSGIKFKLVVKGTTSNIKLKVSTGNTTSALASNLNYTTLSSTNSYSRNGWTILEYTHDGSGTLNAIALNLGSTGTTYLGQFSMEKNSAAAGIGIGVISSVTAVTNLTCENQQTETIGSARLTWDAPATDVQIHHYNVYLVRGGVTTLVGQTRDEAFYIPKFNRNGASEQNFEVIVKSVRWDLEEDTNGTNITIPFPAMSKPEVTISASPTLCTTGTNITCTAKGTNFPTTYNWTIPEGATVVSGQGTANLVIKLNTEGYYDITCTVGNASGTTTKTEQKLINVSADTYNCAMNNSPISQSKSVTVSGYTNSNENGPKLVDGNLTGSKWCVGAKVSTAVIDLGGMYELYHTKLYDCRVAEDYENLENFNIYVSSDKIDWTLVAAVTGLPTRPTGVGSYDANIIKTWIKPCVGRYVKFEPYDNEKLITVRAYEFQVYGCAYNSKIKLTGASDVHLNIEENTTVTLNYSGFEQGATPIVSTVLENNDNTVSITNMNVTTANAEGKGTITFQVNGLNHTIGNKCTVRLSDGVEIVTNEFTIQVTDPDRVNLLSTSTPIIYYGRNGNPWNISENWTKDVDDAQNDNFAKYISDGDDWSYYYGPYSSTQTRWLVSYELPQSLAIGANYDWGNLRMYMYGISYITNWKVLVSVNGEDGEENWTEIASGDTPSSSSFNPAVTDNSPDGTRYIRFYFTISSSYFAPREFEIYRIKDITVGLETPVATAVEGTRIYPNPVNITESLRIESENMANISVYTMQGALIESRAVSGNSTSMSMSGYSAGNYLFVITNDKGARTYNKVTVK